jgi:hypothetical protein
MSSLPPPSAAKPSSDWDTPRTSSTYCWSCCWLVSSIALKTPVISSLTKRGKLIALIMLRVVPAMLATARPPSSSFAPIARDTGTVLAFAGVGAIAASSSSSLAACAMRTNE